MGRRKMPPKGHFCSPRKSAHMCGRHIDASSTDTRPKRVVMRFSKALWFAAMAAVISVAPVALAQSASGQNPPTAAKPKPAADAKAGAAADSKAGATAGAAGATATDPKAAKPAAGADAKAAGAAGAGT